MPGHQPSPEPGADSTALTLNVELHLGEGEFMELPMRFGYRADAPFAVAMAFPGFDPPTRTWEFSRDLLWKGLHRPAGTGDVRIAPPCRCHRPGRLRITLRADDGTAVIDVPAGPLRRWLRAQVFALVPRGREAELIDWDAELTRLAGGR
ncbi:SsgA family sporulation/cell division regulator [Kitasatospora sp. NPDC057692]|uniref:SsgA family sporulation/cell division regulator n=1 Tax=Kitasatospora sp. NPDC057692 TaxID=3346215 RepID=UPI003689865D